MSEEKKPLLNPERTYTEVAEEFNRRNNTNISRTTAFNECRNAEKKMARLLRELLSDIPSPARVEKLIRDNWSLPRMRRWLRDAANQLKLPF